MRRALLVVVGILAIGGIVAAFSAVHRSGGAPAGWSAAWAPDGGRIAFLSGVQGVPPDLWIMDAGGRNQRRLTVRGARSFWWAPDGRSLMVASLRTGREHWWSVEAATGAERPIWGFLPPKAESVVPSPDGRRLAFTAPEGKFRDLWISAGDGSERRAISQNFWIRSVTWTPDGQRLLFSVGRVVTLAVWQYDMQTKTMGQLHGGFAGPLAVSPDSAQAAFSIPLGGGQHDIVVFDLRKNVKRTLKIVESDGGNLAWSPDGQTIAFSTRTRNGRVVMVVPVLGGKPRPVTREWADARVLGWSRDGRTFLIEAAGDNNFSSDLYLADTRWRRLGALVPNALTRSKLTRSRPSEWGPTWSPDGSTLAYISDDGGRPRVWFLEEGRRQPVGPPFFGDTAVSWSPNGKRLLLDGRDLRILSRDGQANSFVRPGNGPAFASWAPQGSRIVYTTWENGIPSIRIMDPHEGTPTLLVAGGSHPAWSPDGRVVAFVKDGALHSVTSDGKAVRRIVTLEPATRLLRSPVWGADGKTILLEVLEDADPAGYSLRIVDVDSGRPTQVFSGKIDNEFAAFIGALTTPPQMADGKVFFTWPHNGQPAIWTVAVGETAKVLRERAGSPSVSKGKLSYVLFEGRQQVVNEEVGRR